LDFQTPDYICDYMSSLLEKSRINVLEPTAGEGNLVKSLEKNGFIVTAPVDFWEINGKFDAVVMNPPFTPMQVGYEILYKVMTMTDRIVALMPWLTLINSHKRISDIFEYGLKSVTHLNRNVFKGSRVQTCVLNMEKDYNGACIFDYYK
jgi:hypothetical protein